ncbi:MAG: hypothetical protein ACAF41_05845 [Leptolyngbya sp. BL-A-14]
MNEFVNGLPSGNGAFKLTHPAIVRLPHKGLFALLPYKRHCYGDAIVPAFYAIWNPNNFDSNPTVFVGNLRAQFSF